MEIENELYKPTPLADAAVNRYFTA